MANASVASPTQIASQAFGLFARCAANAANKAVAPISMPPTPGTAVKAPDRSIVLRMNSRLSMACE